MGSDDDKKKEEIEAANLLQKVSMFKDEDENPTLFGGVLTAFIPVLLLCYAIFLTVQKIKAGPTIISNSTTTRNFLNVMMKQELDEMQVKLNIKCVSEYGCIFATPGTPDMSATLVTLETGQSKVFDVKYDDVESTLWVAHRACFNGKNNTAGCSDPLDTTFKPQVNTRDFWMTQKNATSKPRFPVAIGWETDKEPEQIQSPNRIWSVTVGLAYRFKVNNGSYREASIPFKLKTGEKEYEGDSAAENWALLAKACPASFLLGCSEQLLDSGNRLGGFDPYGPAYYGLPGGYSGVDYPPGVYPPGYNPAYYGFPVGDYSGGYYAPSEESGTPTTEIEPTATDNFAATETVPAGPVVAGTFGIAASPPSTKKKTPQKFGTFHTIKLDSKVEVVYEIPLDGSKVALEILGQIGGVYGLVMSAFEAIHKAYLKLQAKMQARREAAGGSPV